LNKSLHIESFFKLLIYNILIYIYIYIYISLKYLKKKIMDEIKLLT